MLKRLWEAYRTKNTQTFQQWFLFFFFQSPSQMTMSFRFGVGRIRKSTIFNYQWIWPGCLFTTNPLKCKKTTNPVKITLKQLGTASYPRDVQETTRSSIIDELNWTWSSFSTTHLKTLIDCGGVNSLIIKELIVFLRISGRDSWLYLFISHFGGRSSFLGLIFSTHLTGLYLMNSN